MTPLDHLTLWKNDHDLIEDYERRYATVHSLTGAESDPTLLLLAHLFQHRTDALALHLGAGDWLNWYCWDNHMGASAYSVSIQGHFKARRVRTLKTLVKLIEAHAAAQDDWDDE